MSHSNNVAHKMEPLTEEEFRNAWLCSLSRLCKEHGDGKVAQWLGISERHLRNVKSGASLPTPDKIWNLLARDESAHDEIDAAYHLRKVHKDAVCSTDALTLDMIALAHETARDEADDSDGGTSVTDAELRKKNEARIRKIHRALTGWLDRLDKMRLRKVA